MIDYEVSVLIVAKTIGRGGLGFFIFDEE